MRTVFRAARAIVDGAERPAAVLVEDGRIEAVLPLDAPVDAAEIRPAADEVLIPGLVDTHVHVNEPGRTEWEGFASATRAAAAGAVTTIVDMPLNALPPTVDVAALEVKRKAADGQCAVDVAFWGGAIPGNEGELHALHEAGVLGVKCFLLDSGVPEFPALPDPRAAMRELATFDGLLLVHAEDGDLVGHAAGRRYADFLASRPGAAEDSAIAAVLRMARETGVRVHVVHLSSAGALPLLAQARADGVRVTVETCPHYLA
ncbi:amidohydrolase family protein, partial [Pseudonocardia sp.]|uniref:amidohydrolase family protein n=1 Tax=Pseudonocardia sp. TaxID=60912 RepID=UPI002610A3B4